MRNQLIKVKFNNTFSESFRLYQGVSRGSVLSPCTFYPLSCRNRACYSCTSCEIGLFADDIVVWSSGTDLSELESNINLAFDELWNFSGGHKLSFKSTVGFFTTNTNRKLYGFQPNILLNHQPLTVDKHPKYLGFVLDPEILCNKHSEHLVLRARRRLSILKYISGRDLATWELMLLF